jgi:3-hydroxyisobutyrate dehydrogenase-like beta-hydroxyacid dehydrogenase
MNVGFVGLGAMGALIVPRLMEAGYTVIGWNRSRDKTLALIEAGMKYAETPRAVAAQSEIVFSIVTDAPAVRAVALGPDGIVAGLNKGGIYVDMSTIDPDASRASRRNSPRQPRSYRRTPSGSPVTVKAGQASG